MRVRGGGGGFDGFSRDGGSRRAEAFRRAHRIGDVVRGAVVRDAGEGLAVIDIDGRELTARMGDAPAPGTELDFIVERLLPTIVLRPVRETGGLRAIV